MEVKFGRRARDVRQHLKLSQETVEQMTGINQPRLSKIENGKEDASADVIEKLAAAYGLDPVARVLGTNRQAYYAEQRLTAEQRDGLARVSRLKDAAYVLFAYLFYSRICDLFDAAYGEGVVPAFRGEAVCIELRENCRKAIAAVERFIPDFGAQIHFPDHLEPEGDMDDQLLGWECERPYLKRSLRAIQEAMNPYNDRFDAQAREAIAKQYGLDRVDAEIADLRAACIAAKRRLDKHVDQMARQYNNPAR